MSDQLPSLFDSKGIFTPLDDATLATLDVMQAAAYLAVRDTSAVLTAADDALKAAQARLTESIGLQHAAEEYLRANFPPPNFHNDCWKQTRRRANN
jgi:hypothetical protein